MQSQDVVSDEKLLHLWETRVGDPNEKYPFTDADKIAFARSAILADRQERQGAKWLQYNLTPECLAALPPGGMDVLLWTVEDYWNDEGHIVNNAVHLGCVRAEEGASYLEDYMDTAHSAITHWMPLPPAPSSESQPPSAAAEVTDEQLRADEETLRLVISQASLRPDKWQAAYDALARMTLRAAASRVTGAQQGGNSDA
jgi:hypothetical protein